MISKGLASLLSIMGLSSMFPFMTQESEKEAPLPKVKPDYSKIYSEEKEAPLPKVKPDYSKIYSEEKEAPLPKVKPNYSKIYYSNEVVPEEFGEYNFNDPTKYNKNSDSYVVYLDTKNKPTLGAGILVDKNFLKTIGKKKLKVGDTVPKDIVESVGLTRWKNSIKESKELLPNLSEDQVLPLAEMIYQMGKPSVSKFKNTLKLYRKGKFKEAADEALNSNWAKKDTPDRAKRVAEKIKNLAPKTKKQGGSVVERNPYNYQPKAI
jgi:hypothetical protein